MPSAIRLSGGGVEMVPSKQELNQEFTSNVAIEIMEFLLESMREISPSCPGVRYEKCTEYLRKIHDHKEYLERIQKQLALLKRS